MEEAKSSVISFNDSYSKIGIEGVRPDADAPPPGLFKFIGSGASGEPFCRGSRPFSDAACS